jgi:hypothetical protein
LDSAPGCPIAGADAERPFSASTAAQRSGAAAPAACPGVACTGRKYEGKNCRAIAGGLFGKEDVPERAWKTDDLRNRTIRLVQRGLALMRGGNRELLRAKRKNK